HKLIVVDRSSRILASVRRDIPEAVCVLNDISVSPLSPPADVIIAFNVICRLEQPEAGMAHVKAALRPMGLLLMDDRSAEAHMDRNMFAQVAPKTYRLSEQS